MAKKLGLTPRQEIFIQELIKGKSQREAYMTAYPKSKEWKDTSLDSKASNLIKSDKVWTRYQELRSEAKERTLWSYEKAQEELMEMLKDSKVANNFSGRYNAIKELNALAGFHDTKQEEEKEIKIVLEHV